MKYTITVKYYIVYEKNAERNYFYAFCFWFGHVDFWFVA